MKKTLLFLLALGLAASTWAASCPAWRMKQTPAFGNLPYSDPGCGGTGVLAMPIVFVDPNGNTSASTGLSVTATVIMPSFITITAASLPLPTGATTEATLDTVAENTLNASLYAQTTSESLTTSAAVTQGQLNAVLTAIATVVAQQASAPSGQISNPVYTAMTYTATVSGTMGQGAAGSQAWPVYDSQTASLLGGLGNIAGAYACATCTPTTLDYSVVSYDTSTSSATRNAALASLTASAMSLTTSAALSAASLTTGAKVLDASVYAALTSSAATTNTQLNAVLTAVATVVAQQASAPSGADNSHQVWTQDVNSAAALAAQTNTAAALTTGAKVTITGTLPAFASTPTFNIGTAPTLAVSQNSPWTISGSASLTGTLPAFASTPTFNQGAAGSTAWAVHDTQTANVYDSQVFAALTTGAKTAQGAAGTSAWFMAITTGAGTSVANPFYMIQSGTNFIASSISTYANVNAGATWTSAIEQAYQYPYFQFSVATDQPFTCYVDQLDENGNVNRTSTFAVTTLTGSIYTTLGNVTVIDNSIRVRITNNGASTTTTMDMSASYGNLQAGVPVTCSVLDNQKTALNELNGTVVSTGAGAADAGTLRVALANASWVNANITNTVGVNQSQIGGVTILTGNGVSGTGSQRVNIASDNTAFLVNLGMGGTAISATNGAFWNDLGNYSSGTYLTTCAGATNATNIKASAGSIVGMWCSNTAGSAQYIKLYNKATAPTVGTDVPILTIGVPANGGFLNPVPASAFIPFTTGISTATTGNSGDSDTTGVSAGTLKFIILYK